MEDKKQQAITEEVAPGVIYANRAPTAKDKGFDWRHDKGTTVDVYVRSKQTGAWKGPTTFA